MTEKGKIHESAQTIKYKNRKLRGIIKYQINDNLQVTSFETGWWSLLFWGSSWLFSQCFHVIPDKLDFPRRSTFWGISFGWPYDCVINKASIPLLGFSPKHKMLVWITLFLLSNCLDMHPTKNVQVCLVIHVVHFILEWPDS